MTRYNRSVVNQASNCAIQYEEQLKILHTRYTQKSDSQEREREREREKSTGWLRKIGKQHWALAASAGVAMHQQQQRHDAPSRRRPPERFIKCRSSSSRRGERLMLRLPLRPGWSSLFSYTPTVIIQFQYRLSSPRLSGSSSATPNSISQTFTLSSEHTVG